MFLRVHDTQPQPVLSPSQSPSLSLFYFAGCFFLSFSQFLLFVGCLFEVMYIGRTLKESSFACVVKMAEGWGKELLPVRGILCLPLEACESDWTFVTSCNSFRGYCFYTFF